MKCLRRNMTEFEYYAYTGLQTDLDENGMHTGEWQPEYKAPVTYKGNISSPSGSVVQAFNGIDIGYTHVLVLGDPNLDIKETGYIVWKGKKYRITAVRPSINSLTVALEQMAEDHGDQYEEPAGET